MKYFVLLLILIGLTGFAIPQAFSVSENLFSGTATFERLPVTISPNTETKFEIKFQYTEGAYSLSNVTAIADITPQGAASFVHFNAEPFDVYQNSIARIPVTISIDPDIEYDKIFLNISYVGTGINDVQFKSSWSDSLIFDIAPKDFTSTELPSSEDYEFERLTGARCDGEPALCYGTFYNGTTIPIQCDYRHSCGVIPFDNDVFYQSPLKQFKSGIAIDQIQCKEGFAVVIKKSNGIPNCVKHETLEKLRERGWAEPLGNIISQRPSQSKPEPTLTPHSEPEPDYNFDKTFTLIGKKSKYNLDYLMPSGTITDIQLDCNSLQLVLSVSSTESGILTLLLPEEIIGNIETILVDKIQWNYISYAGNTVTVMIPENTKTIEIKGSYRDNLRGEECR